MAEERLSPSFLETRPPPKRTGLQNDADGQQQICAGHKRGFRFKGRGFCTQALSLEDSRQDRRLAAAALVLEVPGLGCWGQQAAVQL